MMLVLVVALAPAPPPRELKLLPGTYRIHWGGTSSTAELRRDGSWSCSWGSATWHGIWRWDAASRVLRVREGSGVTPSFEWAVKLDASLSGRTLSGGPGVNVKLALLPKGPERILAMPPEDR